MPVNNLSTLEQLEQRDYLSSVSIVSSNPIAAESDVRFQPSEMRPFEPRAALYQVYSNFGRVGEIDVASGEFVNTNSRVGEKINAVGFRSEDLFAYGILSASTTLGRIDGDGQLERLGAIAGLPTDQGTYYVGDFADDLLFVRNGREMNKLYGIDVETRTVEKVLQTDAPLHNIYDLAFNPVDRKFYASRRGSENSLISISMNGAVETIGDNGLQKLTFGGMYADAEGSIFGVANQTGGVYRFDTQTGEATWVALGPASGTNDGFSNSDSVLELPPAAVNDVFTVLSVEDVTANVFDDNGLGADVDGNQDSLRVIAIENLNDVGETVRLKSGADVLIKEDGSFVYESNGIFRHLPVGQTGTDRFEYTIADEGGLTDSAIVELTFEGISRNGNFNGATVRGLEYYGIEPSDVTLTNVGDLNGDGFDDAMVGAVGAFKGAGAIFLINGTADGINESFDVNALLPSNGADGSLGSVFVGANANDRAGTSISKLGDVNGDGLDDVVFSATDRDSTDAVNSGGVYVIFGRKSGFEPLVDLRDVEANEDGLGILIEGRNSHDLIGQTVKGIGDFNNDGLNDIAIAAPHADANGLKNVGQTYVVYGSNEPWDNISVRSLLESDGRQGGTFTGSQAHSLSGSTIDGDADLNGDGIADLLIAAKYADGDGLVDSGRTYLVYGRSETFSAQFTLSELLKSHGGDGTLGTVIEGSTRKSNEGSHVRIVEDRDQDGVDELEYQGALIDIRDYDQTQVRTVSFRETKVFLDNFDDGVDYDDRDWDRYVSGATLHSTEGTQVTIWGDPHVVITIDGVTERFDIGYGKGEVKLDDLVIRWESEAYDPNYPDRQLPLLSFAIDGLDAASVLQIRTDDGVDVIDQETILTDSQLRDFAHELRRYAGLATDPLRKV